MKKRFTIFAVLLVLIFPEAAVSIFEPAPASLQFDPVGSFSSSKNMNGVVVVGNKSYIANAGNGLVVIDLDTPSAPKLSGQYDFEDATGVVVEDQKAYVVQQGQLEGYQIQKDKLLIFDLSVTPQLIGEYIHSSGQNLYYICKAGDMVYLTESEKLILIDVSVPSNPKKIAEYKFGMTNLAHPHVDVVNNIAYVGGGSAGLLIIDVGDPSNIKEIEWFETPGWAIDVKVAGNIAYVTGWEDGLIAIDVSNPTFPIKAGEYALESSRIAIDLSIAGNVLYMSYIDQSNNDDGFIALSLNDPYNLTKIGEYNGMDPIRDLFGLDEQLYVASENALYIFNVTESYEPSANLMVSPKTLSIPNGNTGTCIISGGSGFYQVYSSDPSVASYSLTDNTVTVKGESEGAATITITDSDYNSVALDVTVTQTIKAVIVAGSGPYPGNALWESTQAVTEHAFRVLTYQGYTNDTVYYLASGSFFDQDGDGANDVDDDATGSNLAFALTGWAQDAKDLLVYLTGHGGSGNFRIGENELLNAADLKNWLDNIQSIIPGKITLIYDACQSGSFLPFLAPPPGKDRILIASASEGQNAYFTSKGSLSFSFLFWEHAFNGLNIDDSFITAKDAIQYTYKNQTPLLDDNGNGIGNEDTDGDLAKGSAIGNGVFSAGDIPSIGSVSPDQTLNGNTTATLYADNVIDSDGIDRVWAVITPPNFDPGDPNNPVLSLPVMEMTYVGNNRYEGTYSDFSISGTYNLVIFVKDSNGTLSFPKQITVTQTGQNYATIDANLKISIPSIEYQAAYYQTSLNYHVNPSDSSNLYWVMDLNSVGIIQSPGIDYATMDNNLRITIPKIEFEGDFYRVILNNYLNPDDPLGLYWVLDLSSVEPL